jgi:hypothetical protein
LLAFAAIPSSFTYFELTPLLHVPGKLVKPFVLPFSLPLLCFAFAAIPSSFTYLKPLLPEKLGFDSKITSQASNRPSNLL